MEPPHFATTSALQPIERKAFASELGLEKGFWVEGAFPVPACFHTLCLLPLSGLDEIDSINFALGLRHFNLWEHQPHPAGYPLYIFFGWIGYKVFGAAPKASLLEPIDFG